MYWYAGFPDGWVTGTLANWNTVLPGPCNTVLPGYWLGQGHPQFVPRPGLIVFRELISTIDINKCVVHHVKRHSTLATKLGI